MDEILKCVNVYMYALQNQVSVYDVKLLLESPSRDKVTLFQGFLSQKLLPMKYWLFLYDIHESFILTLLISTH